MYYIYMHIYIYICIYIYMYISLFLPNWCATHQAHSHCLSQFALVAGVNPPTHLLWSKNDVLPANSGSILLVESSFQFAWLLPSLMIMTEQELYSTHISNITYLLILTVLNNIISWLKLTQKTVSWVWENPWKLVRSSRWHQRASHHVPPQGPATGKEVVRRAASEEIADPSHLWDKLGH